MTATSHRPFTLANPHLRLFVGAVLISFSPVFVALADVSPTTSGFYRVFIGGVALSVFIYATGRRFNLPRTVWRALLLAAVAFAFDLWFWHRSIVYIGPGVATLLGNMQVFFMMAAGVFLLRQRPTVAQLVAVPLAIAGLAMIISPEWNGLTPNYRIGVVFGVLTAMSYASYMLCMRLVRLDSPYTVPMREVAAMSLIVTVLLGVTALAEGESLAITTGADLLWLSGYGLLCHASGLMFIVSSLNKVSTTEVGIALLLQPALSYLWDILLFDRPVSAIEIAGACIALFAIFLGAGLRSNKVQRAA